MHRALALTVVLFAGESPAASPTLGSVMPRGGQRGTEDAEVKATLKIAADCTLGEHAVRLRTASGVSELKTFWVGALPVVEEKEPNSEFAAAQPVPLNVTVHGSITSEDVDYFAVE